MPKRKLSGSISRKLILLVILFSSLITLCMTAIQLFMEYKRDVAGIHDRIDQIETSYKDSLSMSLWTFDKIQLQLLLAGICNLPDIEYSEVTSDGKIIATAGESNSGEELIRKLHLTFEDRGTFREIGDLTIVATLSNVQKRLLNRLGIVLLPNVVNTFLVAIFISYIFSFLVMRHLRKMADFTEILTTESLGNSLSLDRSPSPGNKPDELDQLTMAINQMSKSLYSSYNKVKKREDALKLSEEKYRVVAETATDGIISIDQTSTILYTNPAIGKIFGYNDDALIGKSLTTLMPLNLRDKHLKSIDQFIATGEKRISWKGIELSGYRRDKSSVPLEISFGVVKKEPGRFIFTGIIRDITNRKKEQDALAESERMLSTLMSNLPGMAYKCLNDADWTMRFVSLGCLELTGYDPEDLIDNRVVSLGKITFEENRRQIWENVQEALDGRKSFEFIYRIRTREGKEKWVWERGQGVFSVGGDLIAIEGFITDISKRKRAEERLRKAHDELEIRVKERTRELSEAMQNLMSTQAELIQSEKMAALGQLVAGVAHEINTPLGAIGSSNSNTTAALESILQHLPKLLAVLPSEQQQDFFLLLDRAIRNNLALSVKEKRNEKIKLTRQLHEAGIKRSNDLADTLVDIGIVNDIESLFDLLKSEHQKLIAQTVYDLARLKGNHKNIKIAVDRAAKIVFALKTYAHFDHTNAKIKTNIVNGIDTVLVLYQNKLKHGVELIKEYQNVPDLVCYPDELNQVWTNLIHNALQAMEDKGCLKIITQCLENEIIVSFIDSGTGVPEDIKGRIFEPFFTTKPAGEGSGLGLDICKKIIDKHDGTIEFESEQGKTIFTISLPIKNEQ